MKIQAALITAPRQAIQIETLHLDPPHAGEVLVRVAACGVCHSDYHLITGATKHPLPEQHARRKKNRIRDIARYLHDDPDLYFDYLIDVCGVDYLGKG